jgi:hypothetical protein
VAEDKMMEEKKKLEIEEKMKHFDAMQQKIQELEQ